MATGVSICLRVIRKPEVFAVSSHSSDYFHWLFGVVRHKNNVTDLVHPKRYPFLWPNIRFEKAPVVNDHCELIVKNFGPFTYVVLDVND